MPEPFLQTPARPDMVNHVISALGGYWDLQQSPIRELPVAAKAFPDVESPLELVSIPMPDWADGCSVSGALLVPREACGKDPNWQDVDWWLACFLLLEGWHERTHELRNGPIHSYSFRLGDWDERVWQHAWVNRIAIFLRLWATRAEGADAGTLFGPLPTATVIMTHDVDAIGKTLPIRLKQSAFNALNAVRHLFAGEWSAAGASTSRALRLLFGNDNWWRFDDLLQMEEQAGIRSRFHFYADTRSKTPIRWLFDPSYDVASERVRTLLERLRSGGWRTGLHQSFDAWRSDALIETQRRRLQEVSAADVDTCRQHWLRFGWSDTWAAQAGAGFAEDTTLMFNDRMGFRTASAIAWNPWNPDAADAHGIRAIPTVFMDSHVYDYQMMTAEERRASIHRWLDEVRVVGGCCAVLWHPHTLSDDYGWRSGFEECLEVANGLEICIAS